MLTERHLQRYADVLLWGLRTARTQPYKKGDIILIRYHLAALRLMEILHERIILLGMNPVLYPNPTPTVEGNFFRWGNKSQLSFLPPGEEGLYRSLNGSIFLQAPDSLTHLSTIDPKRIGQQVLARKPLRDIMDQRDAQGLFGWTLGMLPTEEQARHAQTTVEAYTNQIVKACGLHRREPVAHWQTIYHNAQEVKKWLNAMPVSAFQIESLHIDLTITPGVQRRWIGISGHNIPSFELFVSPDWRGTQGIYFANLPTYRSGNRVSDVHLEFRKGRAATISAGQGEAFVRKQLTMDVGAGRVGEFSLTDKRFSPINQFMANTLFDENHGGKNGNCHIAMGSSYADTYSGDPLQLTQERRQQLGFNDSALHWDLVNTEKKRVIAHLSTGQRVTIYENGIFTY